MKNYPIINGQFNSVVDYKKLIEMQSEGISEKVVSKKKVLKKDLHSSKQALQRKYLPKN